MTSYIIIDDEPIAHRIIEKYCTDLSNLEKIGNCYNALEAMQLLNERPVDLLFLDINMPKLSGLDFLKTLHHPPKVIVTTAYKEFALEGFEMQVSDYLVKPFSFERFVKAIIKVNKEINPALHPVASEEKNKRFFVKSDKQYHQVHADDILFLEAYGHYTKIHLSKTTILSPQKISSYETMLSNEEFVRVHKSFIVAIKNITLIEGNRITIASHQIPVGQTYKSKLNALFY